MINGGGHPNAPASITRLNEAGRTTAFVKSQLTVTFDWRWLQCPPPLTLFPASNKIYVVVDGMLLFAIHYDKYCNRAKIIKPMITGLEWVEITLGDRNRCYNMFRMSPTVFHRLHDMLVESYGLKSSTKSTWWRL